MEMVKIALACANAAAVVVDVAKVAVVVDVAKVAVVVVGSVVDSAGSNAADPAAVAVVRDARVAAVEKAAAGVRSGRRAI
jgi:hypothetical protein